MQHAGALFRQDFLAPIIPCGAKNAYLFLGLDICEQKPLLDILGALEIGSKVIEYTLVYCNVLQNTIICLTYDNIP